MTDECGQIPLPSSSMVWYDARKLEGEAQQPETATIARYDTPANDDCPTGALIDVNSGFIVYAVKNGLIRVLDRRSQLKILLRGHISKVTDISFFENGDVLGTIGGNLLIWRIFMRESDLCAEKLLEIPADLLNMRRMLWHPFIANQFWLIHDCQNYERVATLVETTRISSVKHPGEGHATCQIDANDIVMDGALRLQVENGGINDLCWSGRDPRHVLAAHADGGIRLWDVKQSVDSASTAPKCLQMLQEEESVTRCLFLPHDNVNHQQTGAITGPFVTATSKNAQITLWSPFGDGTPTKLSVFAMENPSVNGYNLKACFGSTPLQKEPPASFLLLSDRSEGMLFCIALKSIWSATTPKRAILSGFRYLVPFEVMHPIYSCAIMASPAQNLDEDDDEAAIKGPLFDMQLYSVQSRAVQTLTLSHAMCVPPNARWNSIDPPDSVREEPLDQAPVSMVTTSNNEFEEDSDIKVEDMQFEDYDDEVTQEVPKKETDDVAAPMPTLDTSNNPFANWLGAIASKEKPTNKVDDPADKPPPPVPPSTPNVVSKSVPVVKNPPMPPIELPHPPTPNLLSPMELLQGGQPLNESVGSEARNAPKTPDSSNKNEKKKKTQTKKSRSRSPKPQKGGKHNGGKRSNQQEMPIKNVDGKIAILKREDAAAPRVVAPDSPSESSSTALNLHAIEEMLNKSLSTHFKRHESLVAAHIERTVKSEMKSTVLPSLSKTLTQTLEQAVVKPLQSSMQKSSKESSKIRTKEVIQAISENIDAPLKKAFNDSMTTAMIPAYESATRQMFSQISSSLEKGMSSQQREATSSNAVAAMSEKLDSVSRSLQALSAEISLIRSNPGLSDGNVNSAPSPQAQPPVDKSKVMRDEIIVLLNQKSYEAAFTKALSASTADMAVFCCKNADLSDVLGGSSPAISQPILLCLMQQLGAVLLSSAESDLRTELAWLQEIALVLDPSNESIRRHVPGVLKQLEDTINAKMEQGDPTLRRPLQMLLRVVRGMQ